MMTLLVVSIERRLPSRCYETLGSTMRADTLLPDVEETGQARRWFLPLPPSGDALSEPDRYVTFARFLGMGTSHVSTHQAHSEPFVQRGERCNACRWFETRIFREINAPPDVDALGDPDWITRPDDLTRATLGNYVLHFTGMSIVTGEVPLYRYEVTGSAYGVIELMTTRRVTDAGPEVFFAKPSVRALVEAAGYDHDIRNAYERAVS